VLEALLGGRGRLAELGVAPRDLGDHRGRGPLELVAILEVVFGQPASPSCTTIRPSLLVELIAQPDRRAIYARGAAESVHMQC
jgi:hypothetical protein